MPARKAAMLLMHLRDDKPGIADPGCWAEFGGAVEDGETTEQALRREVALKCDALAPKRALKNLEQL